MAKMRFGIFLAPFHAAGQNPTVALQRDLELVQQLDRLGYDEVWVGEHHSAGFELIADPHIFIAAAAERTRRIRIGTGVTSLPYHNPFMVAERMVLLDHLTRGRAMMGLGPGALPSDAAMIGLDPVQLRPRLEEGMEAVMHLLTSEEPLTMKTEWFDLRDAILHYRPFSEPLFDITVAAVASPSGPRLAGKYGVGLLSIGATQAAGFDALGLHWNVMEERAKTFGTSVDRKDWRLVGPMHIAETKEQAYEDVRFGMEDWFRYFQKVAAFPQMAVQGDVLTEMIDFVNEGGLGVVGTPDDAIKQIERLEAQAGGFGCYLMLAHEWANPEKTTLSYDLFARYVMPHFQYQKRALLNARDRAAKHRERLAGRNMLAVEEMVARHEAEVGGAAE
jgi:limonene 1,2-monooxygenase